MSLFKSFANINEIIEDRGSDDIEVKEIIEEVPYTATPEEIESEEVKVAIDEINEELVDIKEDVDEVQEKVEDLAIQTESILTPIQANIRKYKLTKSMHAFLSDDDLLNEIVSDLETPEGEPVTSETIEELPEEVQKQITEEVAEERFPKMVHKLYSSLLISRESMNDKIGSYINTYRNLIPYYSTRIDKISTESFSNTTLPTSEFRLMHRNDIIAFCEKAVDTNKQLNALSKMAVDFVKKVTMEEEILEEQLEDQIEESNKEAEKIAVELKKEPIYHYQLKKLPVAKKSLREQGWETSKFSSDGKKIKKAVDHMAKITKFSTESYKKELSQYKASNKANVAKAVLVAEELLSLIPDIQYQMVQEVKRCADMYCKIASVIKMK